MVTYIQLWRHNDWGVYFRRNEAFCHFLARDDDTRQVVHVEEVPLKILLFRVVRFLRKKKNPSNDRQHIIKSLSPSPVQVDDKTFLSAVITLGGSHVSVLGCINRVLIEFQLKVKLRNVVAPKVLIAYPPSLLPSVGVKLIDHDYVLVDMIDDVIAREKRKRSMRYLENQYREVLLSADKIIATSESLKDYQTLSKITIEVVPNGVHAEPYEKHRLSSKAWKNRRERAVVGYVGSINATFDKRLVEACLEELNDVCFVFYGFFDRVGAGYLAHLKQYQAFSFLGALHYSKVPGFLCGCDVLIMPKKSDYTTTGGDSMKIYQYLATGNPVVSTSVAPAPRFRESIYVADDPEPFANALRQALEENDPEKRQRRIELAEDNSWQGIIGNVIFDVKGSLRNKEVL